MTRCSAGYFGAFTPPGRPLDLSKIQIKVNVSDFDIIIHVIKTKFNFIPLNLSYKINETVKADLQT